MNRPNWCGDKTCSPVCFMPTKGGGQCIGVLDVPTDHISKAINPISRCHYDKVVKKSHSFLINQADIIIDTYLGGEALKAIGAYLPNNIIDNLPREE